MHIIDNTFILRYNEEYKRIMRKELTRNYNILLIFSKLKMLYITLLDYLKNNKLKKIL